MNAWARLEERIRGWLPKEPEATNLTMMTSHTPIMRQSSKLFLTLGATLIALFCYSTLLVFYNVQFSLNIAWILLIAYIVGIGMAIVGSTLSVRLNTSIPSLMKKPIVIIGLFFLTLSVLGFIFNEFCSAFISTYPFSVHSLLLRLLIYWRVVGWFEPASLCFGFFGCILLLTRNALSPKFAKTEIPLKRYNIAYYALAIGAAIIIAGLLIEALGFISVPAYLFLQSAFTVFYAYINPLGIVCLTLSWVTIVSSYSKRTPALSPTLYAVFVGLTVILFLIPI